MTSAYRVSLFIFAAALCIATGSASDEMDTWDEWLKPEAASLSRAAREAFKDALLACSLYDDNPRDTSLKRGCDQETNTFRLEFGQRYPMIANALKAMSVGVQNEQLLSDMGKSTEPLEQSLADKFRESLEKAYQESQPD
jgi:hypothetical protein